jgi:hypothetical protein
MKRTTTILLPLLLVAVAVSVSVLSSVGHQGFSAWQWGFAVLAVLLSAMLAGALLNLAVFAPVYWLLGKLHFRNSEKGTSHERKNS